MHKKRTHTHTPAFHVTQELSYFLEGSCVVTPDGGQVGWGTSCEGNGCCLGCPCTSAALETGVDGAEAQALIWGIAQGWICQAIEP